MNPIRPGERDLTPALFRVTIQSKISLALLIPTTLDDLEITWSLIVGVPNERTVLQAIEVTRMFTPLSNM